jgi:prepilin-type N-terminal cleavage/methylation domain-containing protein
MLRASITYRVPKGFTIIELMIVVAIIGLIMAVAVPKLLNLIQGKQTQLEEISQVAAEPPQALPQPGVAGSMARIAVMDVEVALTPSQILHGFKVHTRYTAALQGRYVIESEGKEGAPLSLTFPFPPGVTEARDVSLKFQTGREQPMEPEGVAYSLSGASWSGPAPSGGALTAYFSYTCQGRDEFHYQLAAKGRSGKSRLALTLTGGSRAKIPPESLQPTLVEGERLVWDFDRLITGKQVVVLLPPGASPMGRAMLLFKLAGLAVLLFGAGFWYLSEFRLPGEMDDFRLMHFLLLAVNYALFFAIGGVIDFHGDPRVAITLAALIGLPLLMLHVGRLSDFRFALTRILPLAVLTHATVVGMVYLEEQRIYLILGVLVVMVAFVTITYNSWSEGRRKQQKEYERLYERKRREEGLTAALQQLTLPLVGGTHLVEKTDSFLAQHDPGETAKGRIRAAVELMNQTMGEGRALSTIGLSDLDEEAHSKQVAQRTERSGWILARVNERTQALSHALHLAQTEVKRLEKQARVKPVEGDPAHCTACGGKICADHRYCPSCGEATPMAITCSRCGAVDQLSTHLLGKRWERRPLHCRKCGESIRRED